MDTKQAVEEMIAEEKMTIDEVVARMPDGWILVSKEHWDSVLSRKADAEKQYRTLLHRNSNRAWRLLAAMIDLGRCGGMSHAEKDKVLLNIISVLGEVYQGLTGLNEARDMDDIPF